jgi:hypothetical protein
LPLSREGGASKVIEDSRAGIQAAHRAGMKVVALATTYPAWQLAEADRVLPNWEKVCGKRLENLFPQSPHASLGRGSEPSGSDFSW